MYRDNCGDYRLIDMSSEYKGEDNPGDVADFYESGEYSVSSADRVLYSIEPGPGIYSSIDVAYTDCIMRVTPLR